MEFKIFLASFNLSNTQVIVHPSTVLSACIGLLQGYAHGRSPYSDTIGRFLVTLG